MTSIVCISDTHSLHNSLEIPKCDLLIHSGDFSARGTFEDVYYINKWFGELKKKEICKEIILVAGNHDIWLERQPSLAKEELKNCIYLNEEPCELFDIKIYGSPIQPEFNNWAFNRKRGKEIAHHWAKIPDNTQLLITHGPAFGILDLLDDGITHVGCEELKKRIDELKNLKAHVCGHIHCSNGVTEVNGIKFINAAICSEAYEPIQPYHIITL